MIVWRSGPDGIGNAGPSPRRSGFGRAGGPLVRRDVVRSHLDWPVFKISVQDPICEDEGGIVAGIVVGSFSETFRISSPTWKPENFREQWRRALERLVGRASAACLWGSA